MCSVENDGLNGDAFQVFEEDLKKKLSRGAPMSFKVFLGMVKDHPERMLRNVFQVFRDMVVEHVGEGTNEYPNDPESINYVYYDCKSLLGSGVGQPFFPDRPFTNRFVQKVKVLAQGSMQNKILIIEGPSGCGKSTFLNNIIQSYERYTTTKEGRRFEVFWTIKPEKDGEEVIEIPCPSHDHPILLLPRPMRRSFLDSLLENNEAKFRILGDQEYSWLFRETRCAICQNLLIALTKKFSSVKRALECLYVREYRHDRRLGEGISIFNPGDRPMPLKEGILTDKVLQENIDKFFGTSNAVKYVYSVHAKTNGGIFALSDIKEHNRDRFIELHNLITEGVHKVACFEEDVNTFFIALMNPEDKKLIEERQAKSFEGRMEHLFMPNVLEPKTQMEILKSIFGKRIVSLFLPRVLKNFSRIIVASRMKDDSTALKNWLSAPRLKEYAEKKYCDAEGKLIRMSIYEGFIPRYVSTEDKKKFTAKHRRALIDEAETEGKSGLDGREVGRLFRDFLTLHVQVQEDSLIRIDEVCDFFMKVLNKKESVGTLTKDFLHGIMNWYDYTITEEVKEALYFYNEDQIRREVMNFLFATSFWEEWGIAVRCSFTGDSLDISEEFFSANILSIAGMQLDSSELSHFITDEKNGIQTKFNRQVVSQNIRTKEGVQESDVFKELFGSYVFNLKQNVLDPFLKNSNFRLAIKAYDSKEFNTFDRTIRERVRWMIKNLCRKEDEEGEKFGYDEKSAREVCVYAIDNKIFEKFSRK